MHEKANHKKSTFVTLTYDDEHYPSDGLVTKVTLQKYIKRLRFNSGAKIKYFGCGEYGEKYGRPHYHLILFGLSPGDSCIDSSWLKGLTYSGTVTMDSCKYVAGYVQKKLYGTHNLNERDYTIFSLKSQGLGLQWALENEAYLKHNEKITVKGVPLGIPRYYANKLDIDFSDSQQKQQKKVDDEYARLIAKERRDTSALYDINLLSKAQKNKNLLAKSQLKEKKL